MKSIIVWKMTVAFQLSTYLSSTVISTCLSIICVFTHDILCNEAKLLINGSRFHAIKKLLGFKIRAAKLQNLMNLYEWS